MYEKLSLVFILAVWTTLTLPFKGNKDQSIFKKSIRQEYILDQYKPVVLKLLGILKDYIPEPRQGDLFKDRLCDIMVTERDEYFTHERLEHIRSDALWVGINMVIILLNNNPCYAGRFKRWIDRLYQAGVREEKLTVCWEE